MENAAETSCLNSEAMECYENVQNSSNGSVANGNTLVGWTKDEKFDLLQALKLSGSSDIDSIRMILTNKTNEQIKEAIEYYKKKASLHPTVLDKNTRERSAAGASRVPLANWAKLLMDTVDLDELQTELPHALNLLTQFENIPPPLCTENIDFKKVYQVIANAVEGKPLPENKIAAQLLDKCIMETAMSTKSFIRISCLKYLIDNIDTMKKESGGIPRVVDHHEEKIIGYLASKKNYNPLDIPDTYLKSSK